jgi:hypothetical protein
MLGGGAAGPGKSLALLMDPIISQAHIERYRVTQDFPVGFPKKLEKLCREFPLAPGMSEGHALHMRRELPEHRENIARSERMFRKIDPDAVFLKDEYTWTLPSCGGYKFTFGHCRDKKDHRKYLSLQFSHLGVDEAWELEEEQAEELGGRVRSGDPIMLMFLRERYTSNPFPGWVKKWFVDPAPEGNKLLRTKVVDPETGEWKHITRMFLPARLDDNPDKAFVKDYKFRLLSKPAHMRARYLYGDWSSAEGGYFAGDWNSQVHVVEPFKIPRDWPKFRSMDWGYRDYGVIGWWAMDWDGNLYCFYEFTFRLMKDVEVAKRVVDIEKDFGFWNKRMGRSRLIGVADTQLWEERGDSGKSKAQVFGEYGVFWSPAEKGLLERHGERISMRLTSYDQQRPPALVFFKNCKRTIEAIPGIGVDANDSTKYDRKSPLKHWVDMVAYATQRASRGPRTIPMELHEMDMPDRDTDVREESSAEGFGYGN